MKRKRFNIGDKVYWKSNYPVSVRVEEIKSIDRIGYCLGGDKYIFPEDMKIRYNSIDFRMEIQAYLTEEEAINS